MESSRKTRNASASIDTAHDDDTSSGRSIEEETQVDGPSRALEHLDLETLGECLQVEQDASARAEDLIKRSAVKHFPSPPPGGDGVLTPELLREHLNVVRRAVHNELQRLNPLRKEFKNLAGLVPSYHRLAMDLVHALLPRISASQQAFVLLEWLCNTYLSRGFLGDPDFSENQQRSPVDMHLYSETVICVHKILRTTLEEDVKMSLDVIIKRQKSEFWRSWELHTDVIECIEGPIVRAESISENVQEFTRQVCYLKLQEFLERFTTAKQELLKRYDKSPKMTVETCLKTLNTLHGLASYIQPSTDGGTRDLPAEETLRALRALETAARTSMGEALVKIIKERLKSHFKSREEDFLLTEMKEMFSAEDCCPDVQKEALDLAYERVCALYLYQLVDTKKKELEKRWGPDVGQKVTLDAQHLHKTFSDLHPAVRQQNHVLLKVEELIQSQDVDSVKITLSGMMQLCQSEKVKKLCSALLEWKGGLSVHEVKEVRAGVQVLSTSDSTGTLGPE
ncbi:exocyst complex component 3-like protein 4 [Gadus macrocephalus]|uniref:exocyst complex component 3-like protein 4 n=1 Tax=Gadus macrocephalus TaxID=80720 RepID=UPI0028CB474A|nr:exocyst complex component 3-like protein 4 [Gadus macrocephalus]